MNDKDLNKLITQFQSERIVEDKLKMYSIC